DELGCRRHAFDAYPGKDGALSRKSKKLPGCRTQCGLTCTGAVLKPEAEPARIAEALNWRRRQGESHGVLDLEQLSVDPLRQRLGGIGRPTLAPVLQGNEGE